MDAKRLSTEGSSCSNGTAVPPNIEFLPLIQREEPRVYILYVVRTCVHNLFLEALCFWREDEKVSCVWECEACVLLQMICYYYFLSTAIISITLILIYNQDIYYGGRVTLAECQAVIYPVGVQVEFKLLISATND